jgi:hypothetical protein
MARAGASPSAAWCPRCGADTDLGSHDECRRALELEPPRFCSGCGRRMKVQVVPRGWTAKCAEHGTMTSPPRL